MADRQTNNRPSQFPDLTGQVFGCLTVVRFAGSDKHQNRTWLCRCDCGKETTVVTRDLKSGNTQSCGCRFKELAKGNQWGRKHGGERLPEYRIWSGMKRRCYSPKMTGYKDYGGRGITVCERWLESFANFYADMGPRPSPNHELERPNNDGPYSPDNCRWATAAEQARNRRNTHFVTYQGETLPVTDWAARLGIKRHVLYLRLSAGWTVERAFSTPVIERKKPKSRCFGT